VYFSRAADNELTPATIKNLSVKGFYCSCGASLTNGERIDCIIALGDPALKETGQLRLLCRAHVLRVEPLRNSSEPFGIACSIKEYHVSRTKDVPANNPIRLLLFELERM
jgi:hypothetical protein